VTDHVGPQPLMVRAVPGFHPRPGVITYPQVGDCHAEPGELVVVGDLATVAVDSDRRADRLPASLDHEPEVGGGRGRDQIRCAPHRALRRLAHRLSGLAGQRGKRARQRGPVRAGRHPGRGHRGAGGVCRRVERHAVWRAAARVRADVGPVAPVLHPEQVAQGDPGTTKARPDLLGNRSDQRAVAIASRDGGPDFPLPQHGGRVLGDVSRQRGVGRVRQVVAEREHDAPAPRVKADDHHALARVEPQQMRDDGQEASHGADPDPRHFSARLTVRVRGLVTRGRVVCHAASLRRARRPARRD
jgi:hypothetical protein